MATFINNPAAVSDYIQALPAFQSELAAAVRNVITASHERVGEHIKWNAPAFFDLREHAGAEARSYPRDIVVFNHRQKDHLLLVFPSGAGIAEMHPVLEGDYADGRRMVRIFGREDLEQKKGALQEAVRAWLNSGMPD